MAFIDENLLKSKVYTIRGVKVMFDADLAEIYGMARKSIFMFGDFKAARPDIAIERRSAGRHFS